MLTRLDIAGVRNLVSVNLRGLGRINVVIGPNGSGKTSFLEAVYLLGMVRSFRTAHLRSVVNHNAGAFTVYGEVTAVGERRRRIGVQRERHGETVMRLDGHPVNNRAELAQAFPLQVIHAASFDLLTGGPAERRQFMDWGVFHVEHAFINAWRRFQRAIKQRNTLLRHGKVTDAELRPWEQELNDAGAAVHLGRARYLDVLAPLFHATIERIAPELNGLELRYRPGWDTGQSLLSLLVGNRTTDAQQGFTQVGPQRADIKVVRNGVAAVEELSRGQQKLVVCALKLAQGQVLAEQQRVHCTYLVDDLASELDFDHHQAVARELASLNAQLFVTCIDEGMAGGIWRQIAGDALRVFHVEHGTVSASGAGVMDAEGPCEAGCETDG